MTHSTYTTHDNDHRRSHPSANHRPALPPTTYVRSEKPIHNVKQRWTVPWTDVTKPMFMTSADTSSNERPATSRLGENGGAGRDRTDDLKLAKLALSQLSYGPEPQICPQARPAKLVGPVRFELTTPRLSSVCSNQLSYEPDTGRQAKMTQRPIFIRGRDAKTARRPSWIKVSQNKEA